MIYLDGHPFFERLSTIFISYLFKLPSQHTVTDILNIWVKSLSSNLFIFDYHFYFSINPSNRHCEESCFESIPVRIFDCFLFVLIALSLFCFLWLNIFHVKFGLFSMWQWCLCSWRVYTTSCDSHCFCVFQNPSRRLDIYLPLRLLYYSLI